MPRIVERGCWIARAIRHSLSSILRSLRLTVGAFLPLAAVAQIGGTGWTPLPLNFKIQSPTNAAQSARYWLTNNPAAFGVTNWIYHCLTFSNDGAFSIGNTTRPRTEQRFNPDYTNGEIQYESVMRCPSNENSYCCFQIHTGNAQSAQYGSTTFMAFWFTNYNGSVHDYSGATLATNLGNQWFQLNVDHNLVTHTIRVWINQQPVWTQQDNGAGDFYFKDGVYEQGHGPTWQMETDIITNSLKIWVSSGTNPPAAPANLLAAASNTRIGLTWNASVNATNYNLKRALTNGAPYTTIASLSGTNFTDSNVLTGKIYFYRVSATDQFGESSNSTAVAASLLPPPVIGDIAVAGINSVVSGAGGVTGGNYLVLASTNLALPLAQWQVTATNVFGAGGSFYFTNPLYPLAPGVFYRLQLP